MNSVNSVHFVASVVSVLPSGNFRIALFDGEKKMVGLYECRPNDGRTLGAQLSAHPPWPQE